MRLKLLTIKELYELAVSYKINKSQSYSLTFSFVFDTIKEKKMRKERGQDYDNKCGSRD